MTNKASIGRLSLVTQKSLLLLFENLLVRDFHVLNDAIAIDDKTIFLLVILDAGVLEVYLLVYSEGEQVLKGKVKQSTINCVLLSTT